MEEEDGIMLINYWNEEEERGKLCRSCDHPLPFILECIFYFSVFSFASMSSQLPNRAEEKD
jgi:hypothetical protein